MILTNGNRIKNLARVKLWNGSSFYLVLGGLTPWSDDASPPSPLTSTTSIPDAFGAIPALVRWVAQDDAGIIAILGADNTQQTYSEITTEAALIAETGNVYLCLSATLTDSLVDPSVIDYRQVGFASDLLPTGPTYSFSSPYIPASGVTSWGQLETLEYRRPEPIIVGAQHNYLEVIQY
jgi:hypothetical protein